MHQRVEPLSSGLGTNGLGFRKEPDACGQQLSWLQVLSPASEGRDEVLKVAVPAPVGVGMLATMIAGAQVHAPNVLSADHLARIQGGLLYAATCAVPWAILHARTFDHDVLECPRCGGRLWVRAVIVDPDVAGRILASLARSSNSCSPFSRGPPVAG